MAKKKTMSDNTRALKKELQRKVAIANKRVKRLEANNMESLPAYKYYQDMKEGQKFSSAGNDHNKLRQELKMVDNFLDSKTSKVREANKYMKGIAKRTGIKYKNVSELPTKTKNFFEMASKVEQYLKNVQGSYHAIGYQKVWEQVSTYVKDNNIDLSSDKFDMDDYLEDLVSDSSNQNFFNQEDEEDEIDWGSLPQLGRDGKAIAKTGGSFLKDVGKNVMKMGKFLK